MDMARELEHDAWVLACLDDGIRGMRQQNNGNRCRHTCDRRGDVHVSMPDIIDPGNPECRTVVLDHHTLIL
jgi:hypothetical protein